MNQEAINNLANIRLAFEKLLEEISKHTDVSDTINIKAYIHTTNNEIYARETLDKITSGMSGEIKEWKHYADTEEKQSLKLVSGMRFLSDEGLGKLEIEIISHNVNEGDEWYLEKMLMQ